MSLIFGGRDDAVDAGFEEAVCSLLETDNVFPT